MVFSSRKKKKIKRSEWNPFDANGLRNVRHQNKFPCRERKILSAQMNTSHINLIIKAPFAARHPTSNHIWTEFFSVSTISHRVQHTKFYCCEKTTVEMGRKKKIEQFFSRLCLPTAATLFSWLAAFWTFFFWEEKQKIFRSIKFVSSLKLIRFFIGFSCHWNLDE